jgi:integrase
MMMQNLSQLAVWATRTAGLPLERRALLRPPVIERFIREFHADKSSATQHTYEGQLRKAAVLLGTGYGPGRITRMRGSIAPYEERELPEILGWPSVQRRPETRRIGYALLGFCGGAGLRAIELSQLTASDVHITGDGLEVAVSGASPRLVPVRREWEQYVRRAIDGLTPEQKVAYPESSDNYRLSAIQHFGIKANLRAPRPVRLRANFVISIIGILPATDVMALAGFKNAASLNPYLRAASLLGPDAVAAVVRNAGGPL